MRWERRAMREQAARRRMRKSGKATGIVYQAVLRKLIASDPKHLDQLRHERWETEMDKRGAW